MVRVQMDPLSDGKEDIRALKCVLVGDAAVGKTSLIVSYTTNGYPKQYAGFDSLRPFTYPDTDVFLLCFNVMLPSTLRSITNHWIPEINKTVPNTPGMFQILVIDLCKNGEQPVSESKARILSEELSADYLECSALTQHNLKEVFDAAILTALRSKASNAATACSTANADVPLSRGIRGLLSNESDRDEKKSSRIRQGIKRIVTFTKRLL
ncbi:unnamed protein product [Gongylonema pulchrum]|uniref:Rho-related GTP-binding protein RhoU n=1 Tax=Gongylonema pulchrum TaxID=637853 RepID=A0A183DPV7_9BILA|nr:unnamed protein product [Gongylonema pulchrum]